MPSSLGSSLMRAMVNLFQPRKIPALAGSAIPRRLERAGQGRRTIGRRHERDVQPSGRWGGVCPPRFRPPGSLAGAAAPGRCAGLSGPGGARAVAHPDDKVWAGAGSSGRTSRSSWPSATCWRSSPCWLSSSGCWCSACTSWCRAWPGTWWRCCCTCWWWPPCCATAWTWTSAGFSPAPRSSPSSSASPSRRRSGHCSRGSPWRGSSVSRWAPGSSWTASWARCRSSGGARWCSARAWARRC